MMNSIMEKVSENIEYFAGKVKSQIINLSTMLTPLQKVNDERVLDDIINAETPIQALRKSR